MDRPRVAATREHVDVALDPFRGAHVLWISDAHPEVRQPEDLVRLLGRTDGFVWVDLPRCHTNAAAALKSIFGFHDLSLRDARRQNVVPKAQRFEDHTFLVLHALEPDGEEVHLVELDQWIGERFLVTTHGPLPGAVPTSAAFRDIRAVRDRIESGHFVAASPAELSSALVASMASRMEALLTELAGRADVLERRVREADPNDTEALLDELYLVRNRFLMLRRTVARSGVTYERWATVAHVHDEVRLAVDDLVDQFSRLRSLCDEEQEGLTAVVEFHQARVATKMNVAMERLALITAILLPITAISSIYGMNLFVSNGTRVGHLILALAFMALVSGLVLRWTRRHGWW